MLLLLQTLLTNTDLKAIQINSEMCSTRLHTFLFGPVFSPGQIIFRLDLDMVQSSFDPSLGLILC